MNLRHALLPGSKSQEQREEVNTRLQGLRLILAGCVWMALVVLNLSAFVASSPLNFRSIYAVCVTGECTSWQLTPGAAQALQHLGISLGLYATVVVVFIIASAFVGIAVAAVIVWRKFDNWVALLVTLMLIVKVVYVDPIAIVLTNGAWGFPRDFLQFLKNITIYLVFYLFPDGRFVPRWTRWLAIILITISGIEAFLPNAPFNPFNWPFVFYAPLPLITVASLLFAQIYRYRRVSNPVQRQQTKLVVFASSVVYFAYLVELVGNEWLPLVFPSLALPELPAELIFSFVAFVLPVLIPLAFGLAILRYRLWDIDVLINRTLVYSTLSALLILVYLGLVIALQFVLHGLTGGNQFALVGSTLAIAAIFQPLRRRIQQLIDRRFYRRKYDAARTLAAFSATLRNEVDLSQLCEELLVVVQETMQPTHVSLWLRKPEQDRKAESSTKTKEPTTPPFAG